MRWAPVQRESNSQGVLGPSAGCPPRELARVPQLAWPFSFRYKHFITSEFRPACESGFCPERPFVVGASLPEDTAWWLGRGKESGVHKTDTRADAYLERSRYQVYFAMSCVFGGDVRGSGCLVGAGDGSLGVSSQSAHWPLPPSLGREFTQSKGKRCFCAQGVCCARQ